jgi:hypothetical protein
VQVAIRWGACARPSGAAGASRRTDLLLAVLTVEGSFRRWGGAEAAPTTRGLPRNRRVEAFALSCGTAHRAIGLIQRHLRD